jgi:UDP-N-acetylglucosamine transferase subunit ALG13
MILVMVGSAIQPFTRLLAAMDDLALQLGEPVVMQSRFQYPGRHTECYGYLTFGRMQNFVRECRVLVGHGATGPVLMARRYGKPLVMMPRDPAQNEIFDDHQIQTARATEGRSRMMEVIYDVADLAAAVRRAQAKADAGMTFEPDSGRDRLLAALRAVVDGR